MSAVNGSPQFTTANAFRRSLEDRLKSQAKLRDRPLEELRREFLFQRLLALVFAEPGGQWVLKGGAGLLMRLVQARFSKDLDLLRLGQVQAQEAIAELQLLTAPRSGDHLTFVIEDGIKISGSNPVVEIAVTAYIGARYSNFTIDLAVDLHLVAVPERVRPTPVVDVPGLGEMPEVLLYPLPDQVADKVCAMYELHGDRRSPSSRYRDLVDLVLIVAACELDAAPLSRALQAESARRGLELPERMASPGPQWLTSYSAQARQARLDRSQHSMEAALTQVGRCLNPILDGSREVGRWLPGHGWAEGESGDGGGM